MTVRACDHDGHDYKISGRGWLSMYSQQEGYSSGTFYHPAGMVDVYRSKDWTGLQFIHNGRMYNRRWPRAWCSRWIPRLVRKFVADVIADNPYPEGN